MLLRNIMLTTTALIVLVGSAYIFYAGETKPDYVKEAMTSVVSKMENHYGPSVCKATLQEPSEWTMVCSSIEGKAVLMFLVLPSDKAPYNVPTSFYLIADNIAAKKAAGEGLMLYLLVNNGVNELSMKNISLY